MATTPFDDRDGVIWMDGELVPWREAKIHLLTHALHYGSSVFEGERAYGGRIFKLEEHTERLFFSARELDMEIPYSEEEINTACRETLAAQELEDAYVRPIVWRGAEAMGVSGLATKIHVAIAIWPWPSYFSKEARLKGIRLAWSKWRRPAPETEPVFAKAAGLYMICTLSKNASERAGFDDALMLDYRGQIAECTGANIFFVREGTIHTPKPDCFLNGITRKTVLDLARKRGIEIIERAILPEELADFQEIFISGTAAEVTPIGEIEGQNFQVGQITTSLMEDYASFVRAGD